MKKKAKTIIYAFVWLMMTMSFSSSIHVCRAEQVLGSAYVQYINPVVTNVVGNNATLKTYSTSSILFQVLPKKVY